VVLLKAGDINPGNGRVEQVGLYAYF